MQDLGQVDSLTIKTAGYKDMIVNHHSSQSLPCCWKVPGVHLPPLQRAPPPPSKEDGNLVDVRVVVHENGS